jgi:crossover junction endodeoxyribonuclease RusA
MERARQMRISFVEISTEKEKRCEVTALPANARLCHRCGEHYIGRTCPKCPPAVNQSGNHCQPSRVATAGQSGDSGKDRAPALASALPAAPVATRCADVPRLVLRLKGQVRGGKNNMGRTKTGMSFPKKSFADWRAEAIRQIKTQFSGEPIAVPCNVRLDYVAGDKRRRDMPAVLDAVWHVLEKAGVVADDTLLWAVQSSRSYDKVAPGVTITFL